VRVLLAPDKFAGTLSAVEVCDAVTSGWHDESAGDELVARPMADGGPGFIAALAAGMGLTPQVVETTGPHGESVLAQLLVDDDDGDGDDPRTAYLEAAQCCGLALAPDPPRPLQATTAGLVPLIARALELDATRVVVGVGGTASTDGGRPVVDAFNQAWPADVELVLASDVDHPLLGPAGAARSFAPQKGASDADVEALERRLAAWASGGAVDPSTPGAGAGGGLGYGLLRLGARQVRGAEVVSRVIDLPREIAQSDLVVTGEGRIDFSSLRGKVVSHVAQAAMDAARPCVAVAGSNRVGRREAAAVGIDEIYSLVDAVGAEEALSRPADALRRVAGVAARGWSRR
jgi:glycerate kinase